MVISYQYGFSAKNLSVVGEELVSRTFSVTTTRHLFNRQLTTDN